MSHDSPLPRPVVVVCGEGALDDGRVPDAPGVYWLGGNADTRASASAAFARHADLVVLDTLDETTARDVRARTALPPSRYLALSPDQSAPPSYRWIDLRTLFILPSDRRARAVGGDPYLLGIHRGRALYTDLLFFVRVASGLLFARVAHGELLVLFSLVAGLSRVLPELFGPHRLGAIDRGAVRTPRAPEVSRKLDPRRLERTLSLMVSLWWAASVGYFAYLSGIRVGEKLDLSTLVIVLAAYYLLLFGRRSIVSALLILRKWSLDWNFRILVLRRNARTFGYGHKAFVLATCGKYGQVFILHDYELDRTDDDFGEWRESTLGDWFAIFSETQHTLMPNKFLHVWQRQVLIELQLVDFVVFDWVEDVTDHMRWELEQALDLLSTKRILIVCAPRE